MKLYRHVQYMDLAAPASSSPKCWARDLELGDELEQEMEQGEERLPWGVHSKTYLAESGLKKGQKRGLLVV